MDRVLAVPNFSIYLPEPSLPEGIRWHYALGDVDHARTVFAFSGDRSAVVETLLVLARELLPRIDLREHTGVHPRIGALDVAPFVTLGGDAVGAASAFADRFRSEFDVPVFPYEASGGGARLPDLRRGGVRGHERWGSAVIGARPFLIAANLDFPIVAREAVRNAAREIRQRREAGDPQLAGVRSLAFELKSRHEVQLSFNLTRPDDTSFDVVAALGEELVGRRASRTELIGVIRRRDLSGATRLEVAPEEIVD